MAIIKDSVSDGIDFLVFDDKIRERAGDNDYTANTPYHYIPEHPGAPTQMFMSDGITGVFPILSIWYGHDDIPGAISLDSAEEEQRITIERLKSTGFFGALT